MDWQIVHTLNDALARHDGIEDVTVFYERIAELLFVALLAALFLFGRSATVRRASVAAGLSAAGALLIAQVISHIVDRARPFITHPAVHDFTSHVADAGFPSDHATAAFAIAIALLLRTRALGAATVGLATALIIGRVAIGVHYPSDVLAGALLGSAVAYAVSRSPLGPMSDRLADAAGSVRAGLLDRTSHILARP